jgi:hypothetical protein
MVHAGAAQSPAASESPAPLPVWIADGTCESPGETVIGLSDAVAPAGAAELPRAVYLSVTELAEPLADVVGEARVVLAGGVDAESSIVCGAIEALRAEGALSVAVLDATHETSHVGTIVMRETGQGTVVDVVVIVPREPETSASPGPAAEPSGGPDASGLSPVRSAEPGTSGAPPFSPLPAGDPAP